MSQVLVVDDEPAVCWSVQELLADRGHSVATAGSVAQAWQRLESFTPDAIVLDVRLPGEDGLSALPEFRRRWPTAPVIVVTAFGDLPTAVTALGSGAFDYLVKPFDLTQFVEVIERALAPRSAVQLEAQGVAHGQLIGRSRAMQAVYRQIAMIAPTEFPVLLRGETGTGKEVAARAIHEHSRQAEGPFVPVCPAALNPAVIESELFGHVRGAFTGAADHRIGLFELAENGTIFLDEIADTPLPVQVKLLRVLESRRYCPVGSSQERTTNARFIAATHRDLPDMIKAGTFREDLYHRLKVFTVNLPALRDRREDIVPLVEHFLAGCDAKLRPMSISHEFWAELQNRLWPGNVRELRHAVDHAVVLARQGTLQPDHLPAADASDPAPSAAKAPTVQVAVAQWVQSQLAASTGEITDLHRRLMDEVETSLLREVLAATGQKRAAAAKLLGLDRTTLRTRMRQLFGEDEGTV